MEILLNYDHRGDEISELFDIERLARLVIGSEGKPDSCEVSISFVTDDQIRELNARYRGIDSATDVLSFECDNAEDDFGMSAEPAEAVYELGDIVLAPDVAERQAPEFGMTLADEVSLLITHGLLHLCGYDHLVEEEALVMEARERELLSEFWGRPFKRSAMDGSE